MTIELLINEKVYTKIETNTPELEFDTYKAMVPELTEWRKYQATATELHEQIKENREQMYKAQVDPITAQINRLRDMEPESMEIVELLEKRAAIVAAIKESNPYPEEVEANV